jgi:creatinine amidohydrolase/Fe(II)-dependent formamide hydrolase-like protein
LSSGSWAVDEITWTEAEQALGRNLRLIPTVGILEQHGPHLPLSTDIASDARVVCGVSSTLEAHRAPLLSYDVTGGRGPFAGLPNLRTERWHLVKELLAKWARSDDGEVNRERDAFR